MSKHVSKYKPRSARRFLRADEAVSALEYAILVGVIAVAIGAALGTFGGQISAAIEKLGVGIASTSSPGAPLSSPSPPPSP